jgi:hypothetical protein
MFFKSFAIHCRFRCQKNRETRNADRRRKPRPASERSAVYQDGRSGKTLGGTKKGTHYAARISGTLFSFALIFRLDEQISSTNHLAEMARFISSMMNTYFIRGSGGSTAEKEKQNLRPGGSNPAGTGTETFGQNPRYKYEGMKLESSGRRFGAARLHKRQMASREENNDLAHRTRRSPEEFRTSSFAAFRELTSSCSIGTKRSQSAFSYHVHCSSAPANLRRLLTSGLYGRPGLPLTPAFPRFAETSFR